MLTIRKVGGGTWLLRTNDVQEFNISLRFLDLFQMLVMLAFSLVSNCPGSDGTNHLATLRKFMTDAETSCDVLRAFEAWRGLAYLDQRCRQAHAG